MWFCIHIHITFFSNNANYNTQVQKGLNEFLFKLFFLGYLMDSDGRMWRCSHKDLYIIELLESTNDQHRYAPRSVSWDLQFVHCSFNEIILHNSIVFILLFVQLLHLCPLKCFYNRSQKLTCVLCNVDTYKHILSES